LLRPLHAFALDVNRTLVGSENYCSENGWFTSKRASEQPVADPTRPSRRVASTYLVIRTQRTGIRLSAKRARCRL